MDSKLSWSNHISAMCSKAYRSLHLIRRSVSPSSSTSLRKQLYLSLVRSHLVYCSQLWRPHLAKDILSLEQIQRRSTKYILQDYTSDYKSRLVPLNLLPLMYWLELQDITFFVKSLKVSFRQFQHSGLCLVRFIVYPFCQCQKTTSQVSPHIHYSSLLLQTL